VRDVTPDGAAEATGPVGCALATDGRACLWTVALVAACALTWGLVDGLMEVVGGCGLRA